MSRILALILIVVLAVCVVLNVAFRTGRSGFTVVAVIAAGFLVALGFWQHMPGALRVPMLIVSSILVLVSVIGALVGVGTTLSNRFDQPKSESALVIGKECSSGRIAIVFHPGGSGFTRGIVKQLGEDLAQRGYAVTVLTAHPDVDFDQGAYRALVIVSPVYGGEIRPPLLAFMHAHSPLSIPVFAVLTGWFGAMRDADLQRLSQATAQDSLTIREAVKIAWGDRAGAKAEKLGSLVNAIAESLH